MLPYLQRPLFNKAYQIAQLLMLNDAQRGSSISLGSIGGAPLSTAGSEPSKQAALAGAIGNVAAVYNEAGDGYIAFADGDPAHLFAFGGNHAYADRRIWSVLDTKLTQLRTQGADSVSLLDAGCGPGTWLRRLVTRAYEVGFNRIIARGFDIAEAQVQRARLLSRNLVSLPGVNLSFEVASLTDPLPEQRASVDITLCLYSVLSHLPISALPEVSQEIARVTRGHFITAVRSIGSTPTAFVHTMDKVRRLNQDHQNNRCEIELRDGRRNEFNFHLFAASELRSCFQNDFEIEELRGLDLFHGRFTPDPRWNPASLRSGDNLGDLLARLEEEYAANPALIDHATHLLLVARSHRSLTAASTTLSRQAEG